MTNGPKLARRFALGIAIVLCAFAVQWYTGIGAISSRSIEIRNQGVKLAGTLSMPRWASEPVPAIVLVPGSGRVRRSDVRSFVRKLVPEGYAVLSFDKRGVGKSAGVFSKVTVDNSQMKIAELASDVSQAVTLLSEEARIDGQHVGMIGLDQAGWIMSEVASSNSSAAFFVSLSGSAVSVGQEEYYGQLVSEPTDRTESLISSEIMTSYESFDGEHGYDPQSRLESIRIPSLWLLGENDPLSPVTKSAEILESLPNAELFDVRLIPDADDDLKARGGNSYWSTLVSWLADQ